MAVKVNSAISGGKRRTKTTTISRKQYIARNLDICLTCETENETISEKLPSIQANPQLLKSESSKTEHVEKWSVKGLLARVTEKLWTTFDRFPKVVQEIVAIFALSRHLKTIRSLEIKTGLFGRRKVKGNAKNNADNG